MPISVRKGREREKIKIIIPMSFYSTRNRKFQKNSKKIQKITKPIIASFQAKIGFERQRKRGKKKSFRCVHTRPVIENSKKNSKKIQKI